MYYKVFSLSLKNWKFKCINYIFNILLKLLQMSSVSNYWFSDIEKSWKYGSAWVCKNQLKNASCGAFAASLGVCYLEIFAESFIVIEPCSFPSLKHHSGNYIFMCAIILNVSFKNWVVPSRSICFVYSFVLRGQHQTYHILGFY